MIIPSDLVNRGESPFDKPANRAYREACFPAKKPSRNLRRKVRMLASATRLEELRTRPANRLEALAGNRPGQHSIRINY